MKYLKRTRRTRRPRQRAGFTLIELMVVIVLIAIIAAMAMPQMLPALIYSTHEGAARHLANFGRSAIAHATLSNETITVMIDLDLQEYWAERLPDPEPEEDQEDYLQDGEEGPPEDDEELFRQAKDELDKPDDEPSDEDGDALIAEQTSRMASRFNDRSRQALTVRAERVVHDNKGILDGVGDLFDKEFELDRRGEEILPEEITDPLLGRTRLPEGVYIEYVALGDVPYLDGVVEIELTALGLSGDVEFSIINEEGDVFIVKWDPITGNATLTEGGTT